MVFKDEERLKVAGIGKGHMDRISHVGRTVIRVSCYVARNCRLFIRISVRLRAKLR